MASRISRRAIILAGVIGLVVFAFWTTWGENHPEDEKALRQSGRALLVQWFPESMRPPEGTYGWHVRGEGHAGVTTGVALVHGLDEPGGLWDDLVPVLEARGWPVREFRYPNDQAIDRSADLLAAVWSEWEQVDQVVLVGHSMGGLVIRDFVTRAREAGSEPSVAGAILVGTPNRGSEWARLRVWLEIRDQFEQLSARSFSLFAALRDGSGVAKIDLRPGSRFLRDLNARAWPDEVVLRLLAGEIRPHEQSVSLLSEVFEGTFGGTRFAHEWKQWWEHRLGALGDGVVTVESVTLKGHEPPVTVNASHRGILRQTFIDRAEPPGLPYIVQWIEAMSETSADGDD